MATYVLIHYKGFREELNDTWCH